MRIISLLVIVLGISLIGILYAESMKKRISQLCEMDRIMLMIENEITYLMTPLPQIFEGLAKDCNGEFSELFQKISRRLGKGDMFQVYDAYKTIKDELYNEFYFKPKDIAVIDGFFKNLGSSDVRGEQNTIEYSRIKLRQIITEGEKKAEKDCKLITSLSVALGLVVVIIII